MPSKMVTIIGMMTWEETAPPGVPGYPAHPIYNPGYPAHPIVLPPPGIGGGPMPPSPGVPTHPIYWPPTIWPDPGPLPPLGGGGGGGGGTPPPGGGGTPGTPTHPIVGPGGLYLSYWSPTLGWVLVPVGGGGGQPPTTPPPDQPHPEHPIVKP